MSWLLLLAALVILAALLSAALRPIGIARLESHPRPAASYDEAVSRVAALQAREGEGYQPVCLTQLLTHGSRTPRAVVLVHGYTRCPHQFVPLGKLLYDRGHNVLVARLPRHGRTDRLTDEHGGLTAAELAAYADEVVDIAAGLGESVTMAGLSGGGVTTAWAAQNRAELDQAMLIAPAFGYKAIPAPLTVGAANLALVLPNIFLWWDPAAKENAGPADAYPRLSLRAVMSVVRLGLATRARAGRHPPAARSIVLVTNANDDKVDNAAAARFMSAWRVAGARDVSQFEFPAELGLQHDLIDPEADGARVDLVYPKLVQLLEQKL